MRGSPQRRILVVAVAALGFVVACTTPLDVTSGPERPTSIPDRVTTVPPPVTTSPPSVRPTSPTTPRTTTPRPTTTVLPDLPPLSSFDVDIVWYTDLAANSPERQAVEDGLVIAMSSGLEGPAEFTVLAFDEEARMRDAIVMVLGISPDEAMVEIEQYSGLATWLRPGDEERTYYYLLLDVDTYEWSTPFLDLAPTVVHEWFHFHQYVTTRPWTDGRWSDDRSAGSEGEAAAPEWLIEGTARWFEWEAIEDAGWSDEGGEALREWLTYWSPPDDGLAAWEDEEGFFAGDLSESYNVSGAAVDLLVEIAGETAVLDTYWYVREQAADASWRDVFRLVFGLTPEEFYDRVDDEAGSD